MSENEESIPKTKTIVWTCCAIADIAYLFITLGLCMWFGHSDGWLSDTSVHYEGISLWGMGGLGILYFLAPWAFDERKGVI